MALLRQSADGNTRKESVVIANTIQETREIVQQAGDPLGSLPGTPYVALSSQRSEA